MQEFVLANWFSRWQGSPRYNLAASDSETLNIPALLAMADEEDTARWNSLRLGYTDPFGSDWLRRSISGLYHAVSHDQIACFAGAQEGLFCAMHALLRVGDHAIVVAPNYQMSESVPAEICQVSAVALDKASGWSLSIDAVEAAIRPNTRLVSVNFPNNPTGAILPMEQWHELVSLCRHYGLWLFSDEVYRLIERDPSRRLPPVADFYEKGVSLGVVSKAYGLAGLRLGWLASQDSAVLRRAATVRQHLSGSGAVPSEVLANIAIKATERIVGRNRALAEGNLELLDRFMCRHSDVFDWVSPQGGVVAFPHYRGREGVQQFAEKLAESADILILPGSAFESTRACVPADHFRIGFGRADLPEALDAFADYLAGRVGAFGNGAALA